MSEKLVEGILGVFGGLAGIAYGKEILVFIIYFSSSSFFYYIDV